ncbi:hypothetical protein JCM3774_000445 [Rhodotorula dairenensis]
MSMYKQTRAHDSIEATAPTTETTAQPYRKILFLRQPYPDNHVDASFLRDLKRNVNVHPANLPALLRQTIPITQHVASIFIFIVVFVRLSRDSLSASALLTLCAVLSCAFRAWAWAIGEPTAWAGMTTAGRASLPVPAAKNGNGPCCNGDGTKAILPRRHASEDAHIASPIGTLIPLIALYLLSPALKTLTRATTSDSIWALSGTLFAVNVLLGDYRAIPTTSAFRRRRLPWPFCRRRSASTSGTASPEEAPRDRAYFARRAPLPSTLSLTAALSGSTVLASRLPSNAQVFSLLLFSTLWFGPFPLLRSSLTLRPTLVVTYLLSTVALVLLFRTVGTGGTVLASAILFGTSVVAPLVRGWLHVRYKDRLSGPWDVVPPKVYGHAHFDLAVPSGPPNGNGRIDNAKLYGHFS